VTIPMRLASRLLEDNCHESEFVVALMDEDQPEEVKRAFEELGCTAEFTRNRLTLAVKCPVAQEA
jgi:hypothetical protein